MKQPARVLIVDDREDVRLTLRDALWGFDCGFSEAEDGETALALMRAAKFDVVFLDLMLPEMSGIEVLRKGKETGALTGRVIILTGVSDPSSEAETKALGVFKYLTKDPVDRTQVREAFIAASSDSEKSASDRDEETKGKFPTRSSRGRGGVIDAESAHHMSRNKILVLDNEQAWLETMNDLLGHDFSLSTTTSVHEACKRVRKEHFALVILDMFLDEGVTGLEVLTQMRKGVPALRAIILTGKPNEKAAFESGRRGALSYVSKVEMKALPATIKRLLSEETKPLRVFLSYERADHAKVAQLFERLTEQGFLPWMDKKSILGGKWRPQIRRAIDESDCFIFCISRSSQQKDGVVREEIRQALERQAGLSDDAIFFIPVRLEKCEVEKRFTDFQYFDLFKGDGFTRLLRALNSVHRSRRG